MPRDTTLIVTVAHFFLIFHFPAPLQEPCLCARFVVLKSPHRDFALCFFFLQGWVSPNALLGSGCQRLPAVGIVRPLGVFPLRGVLAPPALVEVKPTQKGMEGPQRLLPHCQ